MNNQMLDFFEEAAKIRNIDSRTLAIMNLMNQNITNSTNLTMSSDEQEYIEVHFKKSSIVDENFKKLFIKQAKHYNVLIEWLLCPSKKCKKYYLPSQEQDLRYHILEQHFEDPDDPLFEKPEIHMKKCFWMKKGKYYDLSFKIRNFVFDGCAEDPNCIIGNITNSPSVIIPDMSFLIEEMAKLSIIKRYNMLIPDMKSLSLAYLVNQNLTRSTNLRMSSDDNEYITVFFKKNFRFASEGHNIGFNKSFIELARRYNIFIQWNKCSFRNCTSYYLPSQDKELKRHIETHLTDVGYLPSVEQIFWMKKGKYYDLPPRIRNFVFDTVLTYHKNGRFLLFQNYLKTKPMVDGL